MELCEISAGGKEFVVDGLPAFIGIGIVLPIRSSPFATGLPVLLCTGSPPVATGRGAWIAKNVSLCPRQIPCIKWQALVAAWRGSEDLE